MKSWEDLEPDEYAIIDCHFTPGRTNSIRRIFIHHNAGNLSIADCYRVWQTREASAHYQVDANGRIGQLVHDRDTAWHAPYANADSIGIEHANNNFGPWTVSEATLDNGAHLVAALCKAYGLGEPTWGVNVFGHRDVWATACPGELGSGGSQNAAYMERARAWYAQMTSGGAAPAPNAETWRLDVDQIWGPATAHRFRQVLGVSIDAPWAQALEAFRYALSWQLDAYRLKAAIGKEHLNGASEEEIWGAFQAWYNASGIPEGHRIAVDCIYGPETIEAVQITLNHSWAGSRGLAVHP